MALIINLGLYRLMTRDRQEIMSQFDLSKSDLSGIRIVQLKDDKGPDRYYFREEHWLYARIDGRPDRRYNDNKIIPLTGYIVVEVNGNVYEMSSADIPRIEYIIDRINRARGYNLIKS